MVFLQSASSQATCKSVNVCRRFASKMNFPFDLGQLVDIGHTNLGQILDTPALVPSDIIIRKVMHGLSSVNDHRYPGSSDEQML